jgi:hypothetical protein
MMSKSSQQTVTQGNFILKPFTLYHTRGSVGVYVVYVEGDDLELKGRFYITEHVAELALKDFNTPRSVHRGPKYPGMSHEEMIVMFERQI